MPVNRHIAHIIIRNSYNSPAYCLILLDKKSVSDSMLRSVSSYIYGTVIHKIDFI